MLYPIDSRGAVINEAGEGKIQNQYKPLIRAALISCQNRLGKIFRSLYVRGSVSVGRAISHISDLDLVVVTWDEISSEDRTWFSELAQDLQGKHPFVTFIDITVLTLDQILSSVEYSNLKIYLKTQSWCVFGEDILSHLPEVNPGPGLAIKMYGNLEKECSSLRSVIAGQDIERRYLGERKSIEFWCVWQMRTILRAGLGLVMMSKPVYSQDLSTCLDVFNQAYPDHSVSMKRVLEYALKPSSNRDELLAFLDDFVPRFIELWRLSVIKYEQKN